jgi:hypothetical protein
VADKALAARWGTSPRPRVVDHDFTHVTSVAVSVLFSVFPLVTPVRPPMIGEIVRTTQGDGSRDVLA